MTVKKQFARNLKLLRASNGLSQDEMAKAIGRNTETVSHLERALSFPNAATFDKLCKVLKVHPRAFFSVSHEDGKKGAIIDAINADLSKMSLTELSICSAQVKAFTDPMREDLKSTADAV